MRNLASTMGIDITSKIANRSRRIGQVGKKPRRGFEDGNVEFSQTDFWRIINEDYLLTRWS